jgi:hypothetical protein
MAEERCGICGKGLSPEEIEDDVLGGFQDAASALDEFMFYYRAAVSRLGFVQSEEGIQTVNNFLDQIGQALEGIAIATEEAFPDPDDEAEAE